MANCVTPTPQLTPSPEENSSEFILSQTLQDEFGQDTTGIWDDVMQPIQLGHRRPKAAQHSSGGSRTPTRRVRDNSSAVQRAESQSPPTAQALPTTTTAKRNKRKKPGCQFFITVSLPPSGTLNESVRSDFLDFFDDLKTYCVALEKAESASKVSNVHLHAFLEFHEPLLIDDLRQYVELVVDGLRFDIQPCRSRKSCLIYITKEDQDPLYNCKLSELNLYARLVDWCKLNEQFQYDHPFITTNRFCYTYLKKFHSDFRAKYESTRIPELRSIDHSWGSWSSEVIAWWNKALQPWSHKRPALYLSGPSNTGKSSLIKYLCGRKVWRNAVFHPGCGKFLMQGFNPYVHKVILFEEFDYAFHNTSQLKRLIEGEPFSYPVKCGEDKIIAFRGPIIFVSNFEIVDDMALRNRLHFVSASTPYFEVSCVAIPKEEVNSEAEDNTIEISSEEEDTFETTETSVSASSVPRYQDPGPSTSTAFKN